MKMQSLSSRVAPTTFLSRPSRAANPRTAARATKEKEKGGTGLLEKAGRFGLSFLTGPETDSSGDGMGSLDGRKTGGGAIYRVLLVDNPKHTEALVVKVITTTIPGATEDHAKNCFNTSRTLGMALVITCVKEMAENYAFLMYRQGCRSKVEPDSGVL